MSRRFIHSYGMGVRGYRSRSHALHWILLILVIFFVFERFSDNPGPVNGADLAEIYYTNDMSLGPGDVVMIDPGLKSGVQKSQLAYEPTLLGIISTKPAYVMGDAGNGGVPALVAVAGRVPTKVTTHGGEDPIFPGDYLTSSDIPGIAMKAKNAGEVLGKALSQLKEGDGTVITFVELGYQGK